MCYVLHLFFVGKFVNTSFTGLRRSSKTWNVCYVFIGDSILYFVINPFIYYYMKSQPTPPSRTQEINRLRRGTKQTHTSQLKSAKREFISVVTRSSVVTRMKIMMILLMLTIIGKMELWMKQK